LPKESNSICGGEWQNLTIKGEKHRGVGKRGVVQGGEKVTVGGDPYFLTIKGVNTLRYEDAKPAREIALE